MLLLALKTAPDPAVGKRLLALEQFSDAEAELAMRTLRVASHQCPKVPLLQRRIVAAALVVSGGGRFELLSFDASTDEPTALRALEQAVASANEALWSWDGQQELRAQLLARALAHGLALPALLAAQGPGSLAMHYGLLPHAAALAELAAVHGLPHRLGMNTEEAEVAVARGDHAAVQAACAVDALLAYLLGIALRAATGEIDEAGRIAARQQVGDWLRLQADSHWQQFHAVWKAL